MGNGYLFKTARACALVSLLWPTLVPLVQAESDELPPQNNSQTPRGEAIEFLTMFWSLAWELEFIPGRSGMVLSEQLGDDMRLVVVGDSGAEDPFVAEGIFVEAHREFLDYLAWSDDRLEEAGALNVDHFFAAGMLYGSGGFEGAIVAMVQNVLAPAPEPDDEPILSEIITPFELAPDLDTAIYETRVLANLYYTYGDPYDGAIPAGQTSERDNAFELELLTLPENPANGPSVSPVVCEDRHRVCRSKCWSKFKGWAWTCGGAAVGCVALCGGGCVGAAIGWPICFGLCAAACIAIELGCLGFAHHHFMACLTGCELDHMVCDPNYVPPDFEIR